MEKENISNKKLIQQFDDAQTYRELLIALNSVTIPEESKSKEALKRCVQRILVTRNFLDKVVRRRLNRLIFSLSSMEERNELKKIVEIQKSKITKKDTATTNSNLSKNISLLLEKPKMIIDSSKSISDCFNELSRADNPTEVESSITLVTSDSIGNKEMKLKLISLLEDVQKNEKLVNNAKIRRRVKRLIETLVATKDNDIIPEFKENLPNITQRNKNNEIKDILSSEIIKAEDTKSFYDCYSALLKVKSTVDLENAITNVSTASTGDYEIKSKVMKYLQQLQLQPDLVNNAKIRRKVKRLLDSIQIEVVDSSHITTTTTTSNNNDMIVSSQDTIKFTANCLQTPAVTPQAVTPSFPLEDIITWINEVIQKNEITINTLNFLVDTLKNITPNCGSCKSRRTLRRAIIRLTDIIKASNDISNDTSNVDSLLGIIDKLINSILIPTANNNINNDDNKDNNNNKSNNTPKLTNKTNIQQSSEFVEQPPITTTPTTPTTTTTTTNKTPYILFIGQLDFDTTKDDILQHLEQHGVEGTIKIRMMTNHMTGEFRGAAFVEVENPTALFTCLTLHHSILKGRKINIEKTCGGRNKDNRSIKINHQKSEQQLKIAQMIDRILKEYEDRNLLMIDNINNELKERLYGLTVGTVSKILKRLSSIPGCEQIDLVHLEKKIKNEERKMAQIVVSSSDKELDTTLKTEVDNEEEENNEEEDVYDMDTENYRNEMNGSQIKEVEGNGGDISIHKRKISLIHIENVGEEEEEEEEEKASKEKEIKNEKIESTLKLNKKQKI